MNFYILLPDEMFCLRDKDLFSAMFLFLISAITTFFVERTASGGLRQGRGGKGRLCNNYCICIYAILVA